MRIFLWGGGEFNIRAKVHWEDVCVPRKVKGFGIMNPKEALIVLLYKWVSYAFELKMKFENINLQQVETKPTFKAQEMGAKYFLDFCPQSHLNKSLESLGQNDEGLKGDV